MRPALGTRPSAPSVPSIVKVIGAPPLSMRSNPGSAMSSVGGLMTRFAGPVALAVMVGVGTAVGRDDGVCCVGCVVTGDADVDGDEPVDGLPAALLCAA